MLCGKTQKVLKRHLATAHGMTAPEYRERFGLKPDYPMTAPGYSRQRSEMALRTGLGAERCPGRARCSAGQATAMKAEVSKASDSFSLVFQESSHHRPSDKE